MKIISSKIKNISFKTRLKNFSKFFLIFIFHILGITLYTLLFLIPAYFISNAYTESHISIYWFIVPIIGVITGFSQIYFLCTGSLKWRIFEMLILFIVIILIPILIALIY